MSCNEMCQFVSNEVLVEFFTRLAGADEPAKINFRFVLALMLTLYPVTRFLLEMVRRDEQFVFGSEMTIAQNVSLLSLVGAVVLWIYVARGQRPLATFAPLAAPARPSR